MFVATIDQNIAFHDIDIMQIVWHGHYFKYFEIARSALMQSLGLDWTDVKAMGYAMPIIDASARYKAPLTYGKKIQVSASIAEFKFPALEVTYEIKCKESNQVLATGVTRQVYFTIETWSTCLSVPNEILTKFIKNKEELTSK